MKTFIIYIVGFESCPINGGVSGFNWYPKQNAAEKDYSKTIKVLEGSGSEVYKGEIELEVDADYSGTEEQREKITERIEEFLQLNNWEETFRDKKRHSLPL